MSTAQPLTKPEAVNRAVAALLEALRAQGAPAGEREYVETTLRDHDRLLLPSKEAEQVRVWIDFEDSGSTYKPTVYLDRPRYHVEARAYGVDGKKVFKHADRAAAYARALLAQCAAAFGAEAAWARHLAAVAAALEPALGEAQAALCTYAALALPAGVQWRARYHYDPREKHYGRFVLRAEREEDGRSVSHAPGAVSAPFPFYLAAGTRAPARAAEPTTSKGATSALHALLHVLLQLQDAADALLPDLPREAPGAEQAGIAPAQEEKP